MNWNMLSGGGKRKEKIVEAIAAASVDAVVLTEYRNNLAGEYISAQLQQLGYRYQMTTADHGKAHNGVLLASKLPLNQTLQLDIPQELAGNVFSCDVGSRHILSTFCNNQNTYTGLAELLDCYPQHETLLIGDLLHGDTKSDSSHYARSLKKLLNAGWVDCWKRDNKDEVVFCHTNLGNAGQSRPDHVFATPHFNNRQPFTRPQNDHVAFNQPGNTALLPLYSLERVS